MDTTLERIHESELKFLSPLKLNDVYATIVNEAVQLVGGDDGRILTKRNGLIQTAYQSSQKSFPTVRKTGFTYQCFVEDKAFVVQANDIKKIHPEITDEGFKSAIFIPLSYDKKVSAVLIVRSINKKSFSQKELSILKLFGSTASLAIMKTQLYQQVKNALETRDMFIKLASHELRTPLTSATIFSDLIKKTLPKNNSNLSLWSNRLSIELNRLSGLIAELLQLKNVKKGKFIYHMRIYPLDKIINTAVLSAQNTYPTHKFIVSYSNNSKSIVIKGDFNKLVQVFVNVLSNAAKFSPKQSAIQVSISHSPKETTITVTDKGKGIAKKEIKKVFQKFYKAKDNYQEGMGLGLFLTKTILKQHMGSIQISSKILKGTVVTISLPNT